MLKGAEVKSLRHGRATLTEAWAGERDGELWLFNAYIPEYQAGVLSRFEPRAPRKLLLKHKQINQLSGQVARNGVTLVPLQIHFNDRGRAKVLLGVGEGPAEGRQASRRGGPGLAAGQGAAAAQQGMTAAAAPSRLALTALSCVALVGVSIAFVDPAARGTHAPAVSSQRLAPAPWRASGRSP